MSAFHAGGVELVDSTQITAALAAIYNPRTTNEVRQNASNYLTSVRTHSDAPSSGFALAADVSRPAPVRHYGLSLLEYPIRYRWEELPNEAQLMLRRAVVELAQGVTGAEEGFLRNKIASLWVEVLKRCWGDHVDEDRTLVDSSVSNEEHDQYMQDGWRDMDARLVDLWIGSTAKKEIVLHILETVSEEVFNREDTIAALRGHELGKACVQIFTPAGVLKECLPDRELGLQVRYGDEGWIARLCLELQRCCEAMTTGNKASNRLAIRILCALRAASGWIMHRTISKTDCVGALCTALRTGDLEVQTAAVEALHVLYGRPIQQDPDFADIVCPWYMSASVQLLGDVYQHASVDINDLDEMKYTLLKKLTEVVSNLANLMEQRPMHIPGEADLPLFLSFLLTVLQNPSLIVSIPVLHSWTLLLRSQAIASSEAISSKLAPILEICSRRLFRYDSLQEDTEDETYRFLAEDIDTLPERHAFLGNYRRYCVEVVEIVVRRSPFEALNHVLSQASSIFRDVYNGQPHFQPDTYAKNSVPALRVEAQIAVIDAALKGYLKWLTAHEGDPQADERQRNTMQDTFEQWCRDVLTVPYTNPDIKRKIVSLVVTFATKALTSRPSFAVGVLEHLLSVHFQDDESFPHYHEALRTMQSALMTDMQRLAIAFPDHFLNIYSEIESKISETVARRGADEKSRTGYKGFLFIIIHRSTGLAKEDRERRLREITAPMREAWQDSVFTENLTSFASFCKLIHVDRLFEFLAGYGFAKTSDWASVQLDQTGQAYQLEILEAYNQLPLKLTKSMLAFSTEKVREASPAFETAANLWRDILPAVLPNLLQLVKFSHSFYDLNNWSHLPDEMRALVGRILTDRFWQAGISLESKDAFYARVSGTKSSYEGFGSTVRGTIRNVRETSYFILYSLARFHDDFFAIPELPEPLANALFSTAQSLSAHQMSVLLNMVNGLIDRCPPQYRAQFLPTVMGSFYRLLDIKTSNEWDAILSRGQTSVQEDELGDEMKAESILRQLTYSAVNMIHNQLDHQAHAHDESRDAAAAKEQSMRHFVLTNASVLEPLILFCTHAIRMRDHRCCTIIIRVLRSIIPEFSINSTFAGAEQVREFISTEVLKACITSLNEPYFADVQKDLAGLISLIIQLYGPHTQTPRQIIASIPNVKPPKLDKAFSKITKGASERQSRAIILELLEGIRGVSIHEEGKIGRPDPNKKDRSKMQQMWMSVDVAPVIHRGGSPTLEGVADMFGDGT